MFAFGDAPFDTLRIPETTPLTIHVSGIELVHQVRKGQFDISVAGHREARVCQLWDAVSGI
jgi:hypothetical protein